MASVDQGASQRRYNETPLTPLGGPTSPAGSYGDSYFTSVAGVGDAHDTGSSMKLPPSTTFSSNDSHDLSARSMRPNEPLKTKLGGTINETGDAGTYVGAALSAPSLLGTGGGGTTTTTYYKLRAKDTGDGYVEWVTTVTPLSTASYPGTPVGTLVELTVLSVITR